MSLTSISINVDEDVKNEAEVLFARLGLSLSTATSMFFRQAVIAQGYPFLNTERETTQEQEKQIALLKGMEAMHEAQNQAKVNGTYEMTMNEINDAIKESRQEYIRRQ